jgi:hypothetical protein
MVREGEAEVPHPALRGGAPLFSPLSLSFRPQTTRMVREGEAEVPHRRIVRDDPSGQRIAAEREARRAKWG